MSDAITVIVPTHQRRERLLVALESVRLQTRPPAQVIVVADGCTDGTQEAVRALGDDRVELLDLPKGPGLGWVHRNAAIERAIGDIVAYIGDDDLYLPDHLERIGRLHDAGDFGVVQATTALVHPEGDFEPYWLDLAVDWMRERFMSGRMAKNAMVALTHRRELAARAGGWPTQPPPGVAGDVEFLRRLAALGNVETAMVGETTTLAVRAHVGEPDARTRQAADLVRQMRSQEQLALLRAAIDRDRHRFEASREQDAEALWALRDEHAALHERYALKDAEAGQHWAELQRAYAELNRR
jgi:hypothetical protein